MPRLTQIFTRQGDSGQTRLGGGQTVSKADARIAVMGDLDELNAWLGVICSQTLAAEIANPLARIQNELFDLGAEMCFEDVEQEAPQLRLLDEQNVQELENAIETVSAQVGNLENFILPGGTTAAAWLHLARTVCRRTERHMVRLHLIAGGRDLPLIYVNRLSDALFMWARLANLLHETTETLWKPGGERLEPGPSA